jgi:hypothetical protein
MSKTTDSPLRNLNHVFSLLSKTASTPTAPSSPRTPPKKSNRVLSLLSPPNSSDRENETPYSLTTLSKTSTLFPSLPGLTSPSNFSTSTQDPSPLSHPALHQQRPLPKLSFLEDNEDSPLFKKSSIAGNPSKLLLFPNSPSINSNTARSFLYPSSIEKERMPIPQTPPPPAFIQNADIKREDLQIAIREKTDFSIQYCDRKITIDGASIVRLGSGEYSIAYKCTNKENPSESFVLKFFKSKKDLLGSPTKKDLDKVSDSKIITYLTYQFFNYTKIQENAFLANSQIHYITFDYLIQKALKDDEFFKEISTACFGSFSEKKEFIKKYITDGYLITEFAGEIINKNEIKNKDIGFALINKIKTLYEKLRIPLDPHPENWSTDYKMIDVYEAGYESDDHPSHVKKGLLQLANDENSYEKHFSNAFNLTTEDLEKTEWGMKLNTFRG